MIEVASLRNSKASEVRASKTRQPTKRQTSPIFLPLTRGGLARRTNAVRHGSHRAGAALDTRPLMPPGPLQGVGFPHAAE